MNTEKLKEYKRTVEREKSNACQRYQNARRKNRDARAEKFLMEIEAFDFCLKKIEEEILKISFNLYVSGELPLEFVAWYSGMTEDKVKNAFERWKTESGNFR